MQGITINVVTDSRVFKYLTTKNVFICEIFTGITLDILVLLKKKNPYVNILNNYTIIFKKELNYQGNGKKII